VVAKPRLKQGGVDPLGLRQVNFDLMDRCIPGLNNAATRLRPYTLVAWAWWKAAELVRREGGQLVDPDRLKAYVDRVEVLFTVGHLLEQDFAGLLGSDTLRAEVVNRGAYDFSSPAWQVFRKRRAANTSLMAPVSYGPSAKEGAGLGYLSPRSDGTFAPTAEIMPAVIAFDAQLEELHDDPCLSSLDCGEVGVERMQQLYEYWAMDDLSEEECEVGRSRLVRGQRTGTIELIEAILDEAEGPLRIDQIRWRMALSETNQAPPSAEPTPAAVWRAIQTQQLHRLSLEAMLVWLLDTTTARPHQLVELAELLVEAAEIEEGATFGDWLDDATLNEDGVGDPVVAIEELEVVRQRERPDLALSGLRIALAVCGETAGDQRLYDGAADRLPLSRALTRAQRIASLPVREGFEVLLSEWVIGQHLYWAVGRSGDETQRLRLMLDEGGWLAFLSYGNANPTPDRLATLLSLASDARIIAADKMDGELVYLAARTGKS
jgi:hypothetical protein